MTKRYCIYLSDFKKYYNEFDELAKNNKSYIKLPYQCWRNIGKWINKTTTEDHKSIIIDETDHQIFVSAYLFSKADTLCLRSDEEKSFGGFLLKKIKESTDMYATTTADVITSNNVTVTSDSYTTTAVPNYNNAYSTNTYTIRSDWMPIEGAIELKDGNIYIGGKKVVTEENEEKEMTKDFNLNFKFGPVKDNILAVCPFGVAAKNPEGGYVYYDPVKCEIVDCTPFTFDTQKFLYMMPAAVSAVEPGDVIMHKGSPMFVKGVEDDQGRIVVIDIAEGEEKYILPTKNMFGFNFITKIVSLLDMKNTGANTENPFGNMLPLLLMQDGKDLDPMMLLMMSGVTGSGNTNVFGSLTQNPLMMYMLMQKNSDLSKIAPFLLMQQT